MVRKQSWGGEEKRNKGASVVLAGWRARFLVSLKMLVRCVCVCGGGHLNWEKDSLERAGTATQKVHFRGLIGGLVY